jgi:hypothetical protein
MKRTGIPVGGVKIKDGKLVRARRYDASAKRRIVSSKRQRVVTPAKAGAAR